ncbi:N-acetyltransferase [Gordonia oryzae]|uniref:N-acetyltransferase n=1 Tax=Gordonia oryzae TaxID=2487349 RepID=A0A3N4GJW4_9ACTN|nr:GNAT family N-acetyltransferase [Gordonia oryzae]RPA58940.1 N-acetyltransferase [Gordonia oryzae]
MHIRDAKPDDAAGITAIYNHAVEHTTAIWNEKLVDTDNRREWLAGRQADGFPVLVAVEGVAVEGVAVEDITVKGLPEDTRTPAAEHVLGFATYGPYRPHDGYRHTVEHSVYVREGQQGRGIGSLLMDALITRARENRVHVIVAGIDAANTGSIRLHERLGFSRVGLLTEVGTKFGSWLDLAFLQLTLDDRAPADD